MLATLHLYFISLSVITGILTYRNLKSKTLRLFFFFLVFTLINEGVAFWMKQNRINNHWLYNIYNYIRFPFLGIIFYYLLERRKLKNVVLYFVVTFPIILLISLFTYKTFYQLHTITILYGAVCIIFLCISYLKQLLYLSVEEDIFHQPYFWIASGLLFYFLGNVPFLGSLNYLNKYYPQVAVQLYIITRILNVLMYTLFSFAFYITWHRRKS